MKRLFGLALTAAIVTTSLAVGPVVHIDNELPNGLGLFGNGYSAKTPYDANYAWSVKVGNESYSYFAGVLNWSAELNGVNTPIETMCADFHASFVEGSAFDVYWNSYDDMSNTMKLAANVYGNGIGSVDTNLKATALQFAIWKALYGESFSYTLANGTHLGDLTALVDGYYNGSVNANKSVLWLNPYSGGQGQFTLDGNKEGPSSVPEPFTIALCAGALGLALRRRLKKA